MSLGHPGGPDIMRVLSGRRHEGQRQSLAVLHCVEMGEDPRGRGCRQSQKVENKGSEQALNSSPEGEGCSTLRHSCRIPQTITQQPWLDPSEN